MKIKFLAKRGNTYQFSRRVPDDVRPALGINHWRWSLRTDSLTEAEIACRKDGARTDEIIKQVRDGTHRQFSDDDIDDLAVQWSTQFQSANRENIAASVFPDVIPLNEPIGEEEKTPILPSRNALEKSVSRWAANIEGAPTLNSADWENLVDACLDEYLVGNPELSEAWIDILEEQGLDFADTHGSLIKVVQRPKKTNPRNLLSAVFADYIAGDHGLAGNTVTEYQLSVDRFISVHGDLDINDITKEHVKHFRDLLRKVPSRPPEPPLVYRRPGSKDTGLWERRRTEHVIQRNCAPERCGWFWITRRNTGADRQRYCRSLRKLDAAGTACASGSSSMRRIRVSATA